MSKIRNIAVLMLLIMSIGTGIATAMEEKIISIDSKRSVTEFDTYVYLNGFDKSTTPVTTSLTVKFSNGDAENINMDLNNNVKKMSHGIIFELYSTGIDNGLESYDDGLYSGSITLKIATNSVTPEPTVSQTPVITPIPTTTPTPMPSPTPTPVPTPKVTSTPPLTREQVQEITRDWSSSGSGIRWGYINITSEPDNTKIYLNGKYIAETIEDGKEIKADIGKNNITLSKDGYENWSGIVLVKESSISYVLAVLPLMNNQIPESTETKEESPVVVPLSENKEKGTSTPIYIFGSVIVALTFFSLAWFKESIMRYANIVSKNVKVTKAELTQK